MTSATRSYTVEQVAAVQRVRACTTDAHYDVLGLTEASSVDEVKKAFKGLARQLHPDKNAAPGAEEAMQRVNKAHETLSNPNSKATYDASLRGGFAAFFAQAASYTAADDFEYEEDRPKGGQRESRKARRRKEYAERQKARKEKERQQEEERRRRGGGAQWQRDFERIWTEYENEMRRRGIKVYYCSNCNAVHAVPLNNDPGSEQAHMRGQQQYPSPPQQRSPYTPQQSPPSPPQQHSPSPSQQRSTSLPKQHSPSPPRQKLWSSPQKHWWSSQGALGTAVVLVLLWLLSSWDNLKM